MPALAPVAIRPTDAAADETRFSICTLVTNENEYQRMFQSFLQAGFDDQTEYLYIDNSQAQSQTDAYTGLNQLIAKSKGTYIILCHQDVICKDTAAHLKACIETIDKIDPQWAVLGNAGGISIKKYSKYFINGKSELEHIPPVPAKVQTLDENFLVLKKSANLGFSCDLAGFHFYGADICLQAAFRGYKCYTIPFLVQHMSFGNMDNRYFQAQKAFIKKYNLLLKSKAIQTTCSRFVVSGQAWKGKLANSKMGRFFIKEYHKRKR